MNYLEEMFDFVEGSLEGEKELELFSALSADVELRNKMKNLYTIKNSAKENAAGFQPTAAETMAVFSALSITPPRTLVPAQPTFIDKFGVVLNKYSQGIIGAIIAAALIFGYMAITPDNDSNDKGSRVPVVSSMEGTNQGNTGALKSTDNEMASRNGISNNTITGTIAGPNNNNPAPVRNSTGGNYYSYRQFAEPADNNGIVNTEKNNPVQSIEENDYNELNLALSSRNLNISDGLNLKQASAFEEAQSLALTVLPMQATGAVISGLSLEVRGLSNIDNTSPNKIDNGFDFSNISIAAFYDLGSGIFVGADIRQESFYIESSMKYNSEFTNTYGITSNNVNYNLIFRYQSNIISETGLFPLIQLSGGLSDKGFNGRLMLGAKYSMTKYLSIIGGFESTGFFPNNKSYNSINKNSVTYGLSYDF